MSTNSLKVSPARASPRRSARHANLRENAVTFQRAEARYDSAASNTDPFRSVALLFELRTCCEEGVDQLDRIPHIRSDLTRTPEL